MREMVGGCCVCSDERGWPENPLVYCDGQNCTVAVHQACYGIVTVPTGPWYCRKCESQERSARVRCELCPSRDGALKKTDNQGWAHVVCALYIPEVRFGNVSTMEPIILALIPAERYSKSCYICAEMGKGSKANAGACMQCNKSGCKQQFHVTCAQQLGLLCEEAGNYLDNVKYCGYCQHHYSKLKKGGNVKPIPPYKPISHETNSSDSPSSPEKEAEISHSTSSRSNRPSTDPLATSNLTSSSSSSSKQKKSSNTKSSSSTSSTGSNAQIPYSSSSNAPSANLIPSSSTTSSRTSSSSSSKDKEKDGSKHSSSGGGGSSSSKSVNKISSSTNNKHDKDSSYSSYSTSSSRDKNKSSSSKSSHQNASNKDDGLPSNSHNSKGSSSQFSTSSATIRITTSSATPTSPVSTIIHKHDGNGSTSTKETVVQSTANSIMSSQILNPSKINDDNATAGGGGGSDEMRKSGWHQNSNMSSSSSVGGGGNSNTNTGPQQKPGISSNFSSSLPNSEGSNDNNDSSKTNYSAMTKKRKAMHQANSSNRSSADENVNKDICKDLSVKVVPIDKLDPSVSEFERHYKKARTDLNSTPAAASTPELNIQNVNPNVIHPSSSNAAGSTVSSQITPPPVSTPLSVSTTGNKSQVITQNVHAKSKDESLVVSVPLSSATTVPGIQLPTNSSNNNSSNSSTVSTIVTNQMPTTSSVSSTLASHGSLYQHLTNNQAGSQRASPLIGRASPIVPAANSSLTHDSHSGSNHTSVLQNMNSSVIASSAGFNLNETSPTLHKAQAPSRVHALQEEAQTGRRSSRSQAEKEKEPAGGFVKSRGSKKRTNNSSSSSIPVSSNVSSNTARTQSNHHHHKSNNKNVNSKSNAKNDHTTSINLGGGNLSISAAASTSSTPSVVHASTNDGSNAHINTTITTNCSSGTTPAVQSQTTIVKLSPAPSSTGSARTSSPIVNVTLMKKYRDEPSTSRTPENASSTSIGGLKFAFEPQLSSNQPTSGLVINTQTFHHSAMKESPPSSPSGSEASARKRRKATPQQSPHGTSAFELKRDRDEKEVKATLQNGAIPVPGSAAYPTHHHMLGNQLNPTSNAAKTMSETLSMEIEAHSIYTSEPQPNLIGPQYPGRKDSNKTSSNSSSTTTSSGPASLTSMLSGSSTNGAPQSLEQLLERQWEQGSQFLMEQAQHFDIASLLSCLHQLKIENSRLEDHINGLVSRRDHLLAVNARLAIPLGQPTSNPATQNGPVEAPPPQQQQQQSQPPPTHVANKRSVPANPNPVSTIQAPPPPMENGLDYRGHHSTNSQQQQQSSQQSHQQQHAIRHSPAASKGNLISPHVVAHDAPPSSITNNPQSGMHHQQQSQQQQQQQPFPSNAQFQQMYHQQPQQVTSHVNSVRARQSNSYQQSTSISSYPPPSVHKTKN